MYTFLLALLNAVAHGCDYIFKIPNDRAHGGRYWDLFWLYRRPLGFGAEQLHVCMTAWVYIWHLVRHIYDCSVLTAGTFSLLPIWNLQDQSDA